MSVFQDQVPVFDFHYVRKSLKLIGRAYQKRSVAVIELSRLFLELSRGSWYQIFVLKRVFDAIDNAVKRAVEAGKDKNADADNAFAAAEEELNGYAQLYHPEYEAVLGDPQNIIRLAAKEDNDLMKTRLGSLLPQSSRVIVSPGNSSQVRIRFQILTSPIGRVNSQTLVFAVELGTEVKITDVLWIFARLPDVKLRIAPGDIPYFYPSRDLPDRPLAYTEAFKLEPLKDLRPENDSLVVLRDNPRTGRIFFECGTFCKTYTNIWKPHNIVILKDIQGTIEAASHISPEIHGEVRFWRRGTTHTPLELTDWTDVLDQALHYPHVDWLIRTETSPSEAFRIKYSWDPVPRIPLPGAAPLSSDPSEPPWSSQTMSFSPNSAPTSDVGQSPQSTRSKDIPERQRQVVTPVPPLASVGSSQSREPPDVANVPPTALAGAPEALEVTTEVSNEDELEAGSLIYSPSFVLSDTASIASYKTESLSVNSRKSRYNALPRRKNAGIGQQKLPTGLVSEDVDEASASEPKRYLQTELGDESLSSFLDTIPIALKNSFVEESGPNAGAQLLDQPLKIHGSSISGLSIVV